MLLKQVIGNTKWVPHEKIQRSRPGDRVLESSKAFFNFSSALNRSRLETISRPLPQTLCARRGLEQKKYLDGTLQSSGLYYPNLLNFTTLITPSKTVIINNDRPRRKDSPPKYRHAFSKKKKPYRKDI